MAGETVITVIGNLTADPELRFTPAGAAVANFTIASTPRTFDRQSNEWKDGKPCSYVLACGVRPRRTLPKRSPRGCESLLRGGYVRALTIRRKENAEPSWNWKLTKSAHHSDSHQLRSCALSGATAKELPDAAIMAASTTLRPTRNSSHSRVEAGTRQAMTLGALAVTPRKVSHSRVAAVGATQAQTNHHSKHLAAKPSRSKQIGFPYARKAKTSWTSFKSS